MIRLTTEGFDPGAELTAFCAGRTESGAVASFVGIARGEAGQTTALELQAYPGFTELEIGRMVDGATARFALHDALVIHRHGAIAPGEPIVLVATASSHRREAFEACDYLMDYLKSRAPFWKQEHGPSGARWIEPTARDLDDIARWDYTQAQHAAVGDSLGHDNPAAMTGLTHLDAEGRARMVDVSAKPDTARQAIAAGRVQMSPVTRDLALSGGAKKGDVIAAAELAGIMAAKKTSELIPLCHPLALSKAEVRIEPVDEGLDVTARVATTGPTGVEMEALTAVSVACLTLYDMLKAVERGMTIEAVRLVEKTGGASGEWRR